MLWILTFLGMVVIEILRVWYVLAIQRRNIATAVVVSGVLGLLTYLLVIAVVFDYSLLFSAVVGEMIGTWVALRWIKS